MLDICSFCVMMTEDYITYCLSSIILYGVMNHAYGLIPLDDSERVDIAVYLHMALEGVLFLGLLLVL
ncbi:hypothetical protein RJT34_18752 [Clitoria ternatea]|uniref:Uncharacterized protein n=1 Tax=Clitoria ternatea TaxID=43366 RepID=A0AAN9JBD7_CLITE